jgi:VWFA-related protein
MGILSHRILVPHAARFAKKVPRFRNLVFLGACGLLILTIHPQELRHTTGVVNVEVPVRVFDGERFVDDLTLKDFEVFENGKPQKIVALYLIRKAKIQKEEEPVAPAEAKSVPESAVTKLSPTTVRNFVLIFEVHDPMPKLDEAADYFFKQVLHKGDRLTVVSPRTTYQFKPEAFDRVSPAEAARQLKSKLRKDIIAGSTDYRRLLQDIKDLVANQNMDGEVKGRLIMNDIRELRDRLTVDDQGIRRLAQALKAQEGQKIIFLFYQKEEIVIPGSKYEASRYGGENWRPIDYNVKDIETIFADASLTVNFIFLTNSTTSTFDITDLHSNELSLMDLSDSLYGAFREMSQASGGTTESSANALAAFRKTVKASENYYLLYYVPSNYHANGKFKEIKVSVKGKHYQVSNRSGYIAN